MSPLLEQTEPVTEEPRSLSPLLWRDARAPDWPFARPEQPPEEAEPLATEAFEPQECLP